GGLARPQHRLRRSMTVIELEHVGRRWGDAGRGVQCGTKSSRAFLSVSDHDCEVQKVRLWPEPFGSYDCAMRDFIAQNRKMLSIILDWIQQPRCRIITEIAELIDFVIVVSGKIKKEPPRVAEVAMIAVAAGRNHVQHLTARLRGAVDRL